MNFIYYFFIKILLVNQIFNKNFYTYQYSVVINLSKFNMYYYQLLCLLINIKLIFFIFYF